MLICLILKNQEKILSKFKLVLVPTKYNSIGYRERDLIVRFFRVNGQMEM